MGTKLLEVSIGRSLGALKGLRALVSASHGALLNRGTHCNSISQERQFWFQLVLYIRDSTFISLKRFQNGGAPEPLRSSKSLPVLNSSKIVHPKGFSAVKALAQGTPYTNFQVNLSPIRVCSCKGVNPNSSECTPFLLCDTMCVPFSSVSNTSAVSSINFNGLL